MKRLVVHAQRSRTAGRVVPDTGGDRAAQARDARHLPQPSNRVGHEVDDELGKRSIKRAIRQRQILSRGAHDRRARDAQA